MNERPSVTAAERIARLDRQRGAAAEPLTEERSGIFSEAQRETIAQLVAAIADDLDEQNEETLRASVAALREEAQVELALCRDELMGRIDSKVFGVSLADFDPDQFKRVVAELRIEVDKRFTDTAVMFDKLAERIDGVDRRRRYDRNSAHKEHSELATKVVMLAAAKTTTLEKQVAKLVSDVAALEHALADADIITLAPDMPALPPPAN